jgi:transposase
MTADMIATTPSEPHVLVDPQPRRYMFKVYPTSQQLAALELQAALIANLWNACLEQRETQWRLECQMRGRNISRGGRTIVAWDDPRSGISRFDQQRELKIIRRDDPQYAAMSSASLELCVKALDLAFYAFWRRLKEGIPAWQAGYPRYKSTILHPNTGATIWHRDGYGWKFHPGAKNAHRIYAKGIPGMLKIRGRFPGAIDAIRTMELVRRQGAWWCSIVVHRIIERQHGVEKLTIRFDLLDKFADISTTDMSTKQGGCAARDLPIDPVIARQTANHIPETKVFRHSLEVSLDSGGDRRTGPCTESEDQLGVSLDSGGDRRPDAVDLISRRMINEKSTDQHQSDGDRHYRRGSWRWRQNRRQIARKRAKQARVMREALHRWSSAIIAEANEMTVIAPAIRAHTKSARGDQKSHGANVSTVAALNRNTLLQAPALAISMLEYKAREAGIKFTKIEADETPLSIGRDLPAATKAVRRARKVLKNGEKK